MSNNDDPATRAAFRIMRTTLSNTGVTMDKCKHIIREAHADLYAVVEAARAGRWTEVVRLIDKLYPAGSK